MLDNKTKREIMDYSEKDTKEEFEERNKFMNFLKLKKQEKFGVK